ncbi:MAG: TIGR02281 family clan AA aspartic protease [Hyphomicrobium sp.]|nr:TIGR02281 family clan AA aspartic protease [Hyphomicrobium sp.]
MASCCGLGFMFSSGQRTLFGEVASWVVLAGVSVLGVAHFDELTRVAHQVMGTEAPARLSAVNADIGPAGDGGVASPGGYTVELSLRPDGHYHADADINGRSVQVLVDTGASMVALTADDAEAAGLFVTERDFTRRIQTANGTAKAAPVVLDRVSIGDITVRDVAAVVMERGAMSLSLLGMTFLNQVDRVDIRSGTLILQD